MPSKYSKLLIPATCEDENDRDLQLPKKPKRQTTFDLPVYLQDHKNLIDMHLREKIQSMVTEGISSKKLEKRVKGVRKLWVSKSFDVMRDILSEPPIKEGEPRKIKIEKMSDDEESEYEDSDDQVDPLETAEQKERRVLDAKLKLIKNIMKTKFDKIYRKDAKKLYDLSICLVDKITKSGANKFLSSERYRTLRMVKDSIHRLRDNLRKSRQCIKKSVFNKYQESKRNALFYVNDFFKRDIKLRINLYRKMLETEWDYKINSFRNDICSENERVIRLKEKTWRRLLEQAVTRQRKLNNAEFTQLENKLYSTFCDMVLTKDSRVVARLDGVSPEVYYMREGKMFEDVKYTEERKDEPPRHSCPSSLADDHRVVTRRPMALAAGGPVWCIREYQRVRDQGPRWTGKLPWAENPLHDVSNMQYTSYFGLLPRVVTSFECAPRPRYNISYTGSLEECFKRSEDEAIDADKVLRDEIVKIEAWEENVEQLVERYQKLIATVLGVDEQQTEYMMSLDKLIQLKDKLLLIRKKEENKKEEADFKQEFPLTLHEVVSQLELEESELVEVVSSVRTDDLAVALSLMGEVLRRVVPDDEEPQGRDDDETHQEDAAGGEGEWEKVVKSDEWAGSSSTSSSKSTGDGASLPPPPITPGEEDTTSQSSCKDPPFWVPKEAVSLLSKINREPSKAPADLDDRLREILNIVKKHPRILNIPF